MTWFSVSQWAPYSEEKIVSLKNGPIEGFFALPTELSELDVAWKIAQIICPKNV